jgi:RHS repeat-associated protein
MPLPCPFRSRAVTALSICRHALRAACLLLLLHAVPTAMYAQCGSHAPQDAPTGVKATPGKAKITITWGTVACATDYTVQKLLEPNGTIQGGISTTGTSGTFNAPSVYNRVTYYFYVVARNSYGGGPKSATVAATLTLGAPTVTVTPGKARLTVNVGSVADADSYKLCRKKISETSFGCSYLTGTTRVYEGSPAVYNQQIYLFYAIPVNAAGDGDSSATVTASTSLDAPTGLSATYNPAHTQVTLSWGAVADADSYVVVRSLTTSIPSPYPGWSNRGTFTTTSYVDTQLYSVVRYYQVIAQNAAGQGLKSIVVSTDGRAFPCSPHASCSAPMDAPKGGEHGPSRPDPVNLATGAETYAHAPDLVVYNPSGPSVSWQRQYHSHHALSGYASPGLSLGWTHSYDQFLQGPATAGTWGALKLNYSNGAVETLTPVLDGSGQPTGAFTPPAGAPYLVQGVADASTGTWQSVTITWKDQTQWQFTPLSSGTYALTRVGSRTGQGITLSWSGSRALTQASDSSSGAPLLTLSYGGDGRLASVTDAYNRQINYGYTAPAGSAPGLLHTVSQVVSAGTGNPPTRWTYNYAALGQLLSAITVPSPAGSSTSTAMINYDSLGRVSSLVDANGNQRVYTYGTGSTLVQVKDSANSVLQSWTQKLAGGRNTGMTDTNNYSTTVVYGDANNPNRPTSVTDKNGKATTYTYDLFGNLLTVTSPRNVTTTYAYNYTAFPLGRLMSVQEGAKPATTLAYYEPSGLLQSITRPSPAGTGTVTNTFTYDALGNVLSATGPGNNAASQITTTYNYTTDDAYTQAAKLGQPLTVTDNLGHVTHLRYDVQGRVASVTDALGHETNTSYNLVGQTETVTLPATGQTGTGRGRTVNAYLYAGGPLAATTVYDESNVQVREVFQAYGLEGELLSVTGSTEPVSYTYDALYRMKTLKDDNDNTTTYNYDSVGHLASVQMPGGETVQFPSYDSAGNLLQRIDGNGVTTNYLYNDPESQLTDIQYPATPALDVHFGYDSYGRRNSMTDGAGNHAYAYNNADALIGTTTTYTGLPAQAISYSYYADGSRQTMTTPAGMFSYGYDAAGRMTSLMNPFAEVSSWTYFDNNWFKTQQLGNGVTTTYSYNALGQLVELLNKKSGGVTLSQFSDMTHDGAGNRMSLTASIVGLPGLSGTTSYQYDAKDQLVQEQTTRNGSSTNSFGYDSAGGPTSFRGTSKTYNSNNQQTGTGFAHDNNGNPITYNGAALAFDPENRLTAHGSALTAGYAGNGLRAWKQGTAGRTYFLYDGAVPVVELDSAGAAVATNTFGPSGLVSRQASLVSAFYTFDPQGSVAQSLDANQAALSNNLYAAHGVLVSGAAADPFGYKARWGYYTDAETNLQLLTFRYYDPNVGRFLTRDPIGYRGGINLYAYVANNSANLHDPSGLQVRSDRNFRLDDINPLTGRTYKAGLNRPRPKPYQPPDDVYVRALQHIANATGGKLQSGWSITTEECECYFEGIDGLRRLGFEPFLNIAWEHWGGSDWQGQIEGNWYHVTVGYPPSFYHPHTLLGPVKTNCRPPFINAHYEKNKPSSWEHFKDWVGSRF